MRAGGADHTVQLLGLKNDIIVASLTGHSKKVTSIAFATPSALVSGSADKTVRLWTRADEDGSWGATGAILGTFKAPVTRVCMHPVASLAVAAASDASWQLLDLERRRKLWDVRLEESGSFLSAAVHPDGNFFAAGGSTGGLVVVDVKTSNPLMSISEGVAGEVLDVAFNENGFWVGLACATGVQVSWSSKRYSCAQVQVLLSVFLAWLLNSTEVLWCTRVTFPKWTGLACLLNWCSHGFCSNCQRGPPHPIADLVICG
jgi:pre-mRNA-processing factor 19